MAAVDISEKKHVNFGDIGLDEWLTTQCKNMGLSKPTEIQENCVPQILKGTSELSNFFNMS